MTGAGDKTPVVAIENLTNEAPAGIVTLAGTEAVASEAATVTVTGAGAIPVSATVPVAVAPPATATGATLTALRTGGMIRTEALLTPPLKPAVTTGETSAATA